MTLSVPVRLGIQGVVSVLIASALTHELHLSRGYWAILTVLVLLSASWGEGLQKGIKRVTMTVFGCIAGWALVLLIPPVLVWHVVFALACVFLMFYFLPVSYSWTVFFTTVFVVFLFSILGHAGLAILEERVTETVLGAAIVICVSRVVFSVPSSSKLREQSDHVFHELKDYFQTRLTYMKAKEVYSPALKDHGFVKLLTLMSQSRALVNQVNYEYLFQPRKRRQWRRELRVQALVAHYLYSLMSVLIKLEDDLAHQEIALVVQVIQAELDPLWAQLEGMRSANTKAAPCLGEAKHFMVLSQFIDKVSSSTDPCDHPVLLTGLHYYCDKLYTYLAEWIEIGLQKEN